jgi:DNA helicase II / ATP-dependent DNA helicase PcrA
MIRRLMKPMIRSPTSWACDLQPRSRTSALVSKSQSSSILKNPLLPIDPMTQNDFLAILNASQRQAVEHYCGALLVVAGAGSGKTRALTYRIANLILKHQVDSENILAVTFTNKAAKEMKERVEVLFAQQYALEKFQKPLSALAPVEQTKIKSHIYKTYIKRMWVGTFHSLLGRILRFDIDKYTDEKGRKWQRNFSIFDDSDCQGAIKQIVTKMMNLDDKKFEPRAVRYAISNAKNLSLSPAEYAAENKDYRGRVIAEVYDAYQEFLSQNNALDFDDMLLVPVRLFQQNAELLNYWHQKFRHILVDEYQDTNRTQYQLIQLLTTNGIDSKLFDGWEKRSTFVVGDADQSIYSFRMADFTILMNFQTDFGDSLPDEKTSTMVKLEENYRSTENILSAANELIQNNTQRIDKILKATRSAGEPIFLYQADNELAEADFVLNKVEEQIRENSEIAYSSFAVLYRTNAQSRPIEDAFVRAGIPYKIVGGLRFYDRREIKDVVAYLRVLNNPEDTVSMLRVINTPRRGVGQATIDNLQNAAQQMGVPLWEIVNDETSVKTLAGRSYKGVLQFVEIINKWREAAQTEAVSTVLAGVLNDSGYSQELIDQGNDEATERLQNVQELVNAATQFQEETEEPSLENFLANAALSSDLDKLDDSNAISMMTLHSSKGLEFPVVFLVGLEEGLFPNYRSLNDPATLEEERRLCYVGITRAQEVLYISYALERRLYGNREAAIPSQFLGELPPELLESNRKRKQFRHIASKDMPKNTPATEKWTVGDRVLHPKFGMGNITHVFGSEGKVSVAVAFEGGTGKKILEPRATGLYKVPT